MDNLELLHGNCHRQVHRRNKLVTGQDTPRAGRCERIEPSAAKVSFTVLGWGQGQHRLPTRHYTSLRVKEMAMPSFVVRIPDMKALMRSWKALLANGPGGQWFTLNKEVLRSLNQWPRIKWYYYCDDANGNTIRIYDTEHLQRYGGSNYLESYSVREHFERVIIRGHNMWSGEQAKLKDEDSLRKQFRNNAAWRLFSASSAPLKPDMNAPNGVHFVHLKVGPPRTANIMAGMDLNVRLWYFEAVNQLPEFDPPFPEFDPPVEHSLDDLLDE